MLFGQKNKISRLVMADRQKTGDTGGKQVKTEMTRQEDGEEEGLDVVLPIQKARDIRSLSYDGQNGLVYWVDHGSKRKKDVSGHRHRQSSSKISIKRAYVNGSMPERRWVKKCACLAIYSTRLFCTPLHIFFCRNGEFFWEKREAVK